MDELLLPLIKTYSENMIMMMNINKHNLSNNVSLDRMHSSFRNLEQKKVLMSNNAYSMTQPIKVIPSKLVAIQKQKLIPVRQYLVCLDAVQLLAIRDIIRT